MNGPRASGINRPRAAPEKVIMASSIGTTEKYVGLTTALAAVALIIINDRETFFFFNRVSATPLTDWLMPWVSNEKIYLAPALCLALWLGLKTGAAGRWALAGLVVLFLLTDAGVGYVIRPLLERPRPWASLVGVHHFHNGWSLTDAQTVLQAGGVFGLPSAHAANSMGLAVYLSRFNKPLGLVIGYLALLIGLSRIYVGMHFPTDVLAGYAWGAASGLFAAWSVNLVRRRFSKNIGKPF